MASTEAPALDAGAHIADPGPLGLAGFASTTLILSLVNAGVVGSGTEISAVVALAFFYGGLAQLLAGMWEFRKGNTFGATAFPTFGAFWIAFASFVVFFAPSVPKAEAATATGMFLLVFLIVTAYLTVAALRTNAALLGVFVLLTLTYLFLVLAELGGVESLGKVGGWLGVATAIVAFYTSFAGVVNATWKRVVLPVYPLAPTARS
ncbi:MAG: acetate uptake transporter [Sciscionella sp.]